MSTPSPPGFRSNVIPYLTRVAHFSSPFITTFLLIHLTAPALATLGGSSLASQTMLLGREYYQTPFGEKYLVLGPIAIHTVSAALKRLFKPSRRFTSLFTLTGYATMLFLLPTHFLLHRVTPASAAPPISELGPSELDYEFVKYGLQAWPGRSAVLYGGLVLCVGLHAVDGMALVWNTYMKDRITNASRNLRIGGMVAGMVAPVMAGLFVLWAEPSFVFPQMAKRFESVFATSIFYRV